MASCHGQVSSLLHGAAVPATVRSAHPSAPPHPPTPHLLFIDAVLQLPGARLVLTVVIINQTGPHVQKLAGGDVGAGAAGRRAPDPRAPRGCLVEVRWFHVLCSGWQRRRYADMPAG